MLSLILAAQFALSTALPPHGTVYVNGQACTVRTLCPPLHPKPKPITPVRLDQFLYMCMYLEPLIIVLPADGVPLTLDIPESPALPAETFDAPAVDGPVITTPTTIVPPDAPQWFTWGAGGGWFDGGTDRVVAPTYTAPHFMQAPEIDPAGTVSGVTLLAGLLAIVVGRRKL